MATVSFFGTNCSYIAHAAFTVSPDPYPTGIPCPAFQVQNISTGTKITIYASEVTPASGYGFPVEVYVNDAYVDYLQSTSVSFYPSDGMTVRLVATKTATTTYYGRFTLNANGGRFTTNSSATLSWPVSGNMSNTGTSGGYVSTTLPSSSSSYNPVYSGYTFVGWALDENATSPDYYSGEEVGFTAKSTSSTNPSVVTLYAVWKKVYTLSYSTSYSGVTNMPSSSTISGAGYITCSSTIPVLSGYTFKGWAETDGGAIRYVAGNNIYISADKTLYAVFERSYTGSISLINCYYDADAKTTQGIAEFGVSVSTSNKTWTLRAQHGTTGTTASTTLTSSGNVSLTLPFLYQSSAQTYTVTLIDPDGAAAASIVINCKDMPVYTLTFNANGGTGAPNSLTTEANVAKVTIPATKPNRPEYKFLGWGLYSDSTSPIVSVNELPYEYTLTQSRTLYAVWEKSYTGSISVNSYTYDSNDKSYQGTLSVTVTLSPALGSWTLKATHSRTSTSVSKTMTPSGSTTLSTTLVLPYLYMSSEQTYTITLTAPDGTVVDEIVVPCLDVPTYTLTFNANGGTGAPSALTTYGNVAKVTIPATKPKRLKHKFLGWALGALSTVLEVAVDDLPCEYSLTYSKTLYAVWEPFDTIDLFTWNVNDTTDATMIKKGEPVKDVITAAKWNELLLKIKALNDGCNLTFDYTLVSKGSDITHTQFNNARLGLTKIRVALNTTTVIPDEQQKGYVMYASLFNGGGSIKGALNGLIGDYNNA